MAKEISSLAKSISGPRAQQLRSISRWLNGSGGYEAVLKRPDVLCFCQPCADAIVSKPKQELLSELELAAAIGTGYCKFENNAPMPRDLTPFVYPAFAFLAWLALITFGSIFVLPSFREMFEEFGIGLPLSTQFTFSASLWIEAYWPFIFLVVFLAPLTIWLTLRISQRNKPYSLNWFDRRFAKFRTKLSFGQVTSRA